MSTSYYLACDEHHQICLAANVTMCGSVCLGGDDTGRTLAAFIASHKHCALRVADENHGELDSCLEGWTHAGAVWTEWSSRQYDPR